MNRNYLKSILFGAVIAASAGAFVSCSYDDDIDELKNRVTVVEGLITELKAAQASGLSITAATQTDGVWTLLLSDGSQIVCGGGSGGAGGSSVTVTENADNFVIKVDGNEYVFPKGAAAASLLYRPRYNDGKEIVDGMSAIPVDFLVSGGELTEAQLSGAEIAIVDAYALKTRAAADLFTVLEGSATVNGNIVTVSIMPNEGVEGGNTYNVNLRIKAGSKEYVSNYFQIEVPEGFVYDNAAPAEQIAAFAAAAGQDATVGEDAGIKLITFNAELSTLEGEVNFAEFFAGLPEGAQFVIGSQVTEEGKNAYDALRNSMAKDGKFSWTQRPGTAFPNGFRITVQNKEGQTVGKADFKYSDPVAALGLDWIGVFSNGTGGHIEILGGDNQPYTWLEAGAHDIDLAKLFTEGMSDDVNASPIHPQHDGGLFINQEWPKFEVDGFVYYDGERWVLGDAGKKYAQASKGLWWTSHQLSLGASNRRNHPDKVGADGNDDMIPLFGSNCNGELIWDGIPGEARTFFGVDILENGHLVTTDNYKGWNMRFGLWIKYEYLYGEYEIGGGAIVWAWVNRRACPLDLKDNIIQEAMNDPSIMQ